MAINPNPGKYSENNPYAGKDTSHLLSGWNQFTDALGFTNHAAQLAFNQNQAAAEWEAQRNLALEDREYNDYASQVERMREAGLNPDLQGVDQGNATSDLAGATGEGVPSADANNELISQANNTLQQAASLCTSALSTAVAACGGIQALTSTAIAQDAAVLDATGGFEALKKSGASRIARALQENTDLSLDDLFKEFTDRKASHGDSYDLKAFLADELGEGALDIQTTGLKNRRIRSRVRQGFSDYINSEAAIRDIFGEIASSHQTARTAGAAVGNLKGEMNASPNQGITEGYAAVSKTLFDLYKVQSEFNEKLARGYNNNYNVGYAVGAENGQNQFLSRSYTARNSQGIPEKAASLEGYTIELNKKIAEAMWKNAAPLLNSKTMFGRQLGIEMAKGAISISGMFSTALQTGLTIANPYLGAAAGIQKAAGIKALTP